MILNNIKVNWQKIEPLTEFKNPTRLLSTIFKKRTYDLDSIINSSNLMPASEITEPGPNTARTPDL